MNVPIRDSYWILEGQLLAGEFPGHTHDDEARKKLVRLLDAGIRSFVDLTETTDPLVLYEPILKEVTADRGIDVRYRRMPIRDMSIPPPERMSEILSRVRAEIAAGRPVYVHCWGGIGRTGTVAGCWLVEEGADCDAVLGRLRELRAGMPDWWRDSPHTEAQKAFVRAWRQRPL